MTNKNFFLRSDLIKFGFKILKTFDFDFMRFMITHLTFNACNNPTLKTLTNFPKVQRSASSRLKRCDCNRDTSSFQRSELEQAKYSF